MLNPNVEIPLKFVNPVQEDFFYCNKRNQCFSGGYGNGKSFGASMKALTLLTTFPKYKIGISRYSAKELTQSTMATFFKICPPELYSEAYGGRRNDRDGYLRLINGSEVIWMHLDDYSEEDLRGKEFNSVITDQAEEIAESIYGTLDARIERWDVVEIPPHLNPERFPKNKFSGKPMPPCFNIILCNPDTILHWIYRRYHPDAAESKMYSDTHAYFSASTHDNPAIPESQKKAMLRDHDKAWADRFYWGKWGIAGGSIHYMEESSILQYTDSYDLLDVIKKDGIKFRVMDHGDAAPTTCLWFAWLPSSVLTRLTGNRISKGIHVCYREYYMPEKLISYHREQIAALSEGERYYGNYADPAIFKKNQQKDGAFWTVADEYSDRRLNSPPIAWIPADNNELATRNAVSELLMLDDNIIHPITGVSPSPALYFIKKSPQYPSGCSFAIEQTRGAKRKKIGFDNGVDVYSDDRAETPDHAYDPVRYYSIMRKTTALPEKPAEIPQFSFAGYMQKKRIQRYKKIGGKFYGVR